MVIITIGSISILDNQVDRDEEIILPVSISVDDTFLILNLLGYKEYQRPLHFSHIRDKGDIFVMVYEILTNVWEYTFDVSYKMRYWSNRFTLYPYIYTNSITSLPHNDILLIALFADIRHLTKYIRDSISQIYLSGNREIISVYRYIQDILPNLLYTHHPDSLYVKAYVTLPSSAPYQGESNLLLEYFPSYPKDARLSGIVSKGYAMDLLMQDPLIHYLYDRRLLSSAIIAGGSVSAVLTRAMIYPESDIDIFVYGPDKEKTTISILNAIHKVYGIDIHMRVSGSVVYITKEGYRPVQIVSSGGMYVDDILFNFDLSHICVGIDNRGIIGTPAFYYWTSREGTVTHGGQLTVPIRYILREFRVQKVKDRGYEMLAPNHRYIIKEASDVAPVHVMKEASSIPDVLSLIERDGKFRNDLESIYHSSRQSRSLGYITIVDAHPIIDGNTSSKIIHYASIIYKTEGGDIRLLTSRAKNGGAWGKVRSAYSYFVMVLDGDLLLSLDIMKPGEVYDLVITPVYLILVKKRCLTIRRND